VSEGKKDDEVDPFFGPVISKYTSEQAVEDGFLLDVRILNPKWKDGFGLISHVTTNLLNLGYWETTCSRGVEQKDAGKTELCQRNFETFCAKQAVAEHCEWKRGGPRLRMCNVLDLLTQAHHIMVRKGVLDTFYSGRIEFPDGVKRKIFIEQNEYEKFTVMLPEDH
jgi:hypothetical protein